MLEQLRTDYLAAKTRSSEQIPAAMTQSGAQESATYPVGRLIPNTGGGE